MGLIECLQILHFVNAVVNSFAKREPPSSLKIFAERKPRDSDKLDSNIFTLPLDPQVISQWRSFSPLLKKHLMLDELSNWNTFTDTTV